MVATTPLPVHWILPSRHSETSPDLEGRAVLCDLDGVLSDAAWRQHFIEKGKNKDWDSFFGHCGDDPFIAEVATLLSLLDQDLLVVLLTGRPTSVKSQTLSWLRNFPLRWDLLIMRNFGDYSAAKDFKSDSLDEIRSRGMEPVLAFEDDRRNVDMFKSKGVPCIYIHSGYYDGLSP
ncbi:MAG: hypothetical protein HKL84_07525 [Acidimicrobiaceae bacterium]|nr:hypothetical protein [Acidimicrobiaceae bacterium]